MKLDKAGLKIIKDSRNEETLEAVLGADSRGLNAELRGQASVPSGKSTGAHEAFVLEPKLALGKFNEIKAQILSSEFNSQREFDNFLIQLDGTANKQNLGGNLILSLSLAFARLKAKSENTELYEYIARNSGLKIKNQTLKPVFNVINGGAHATNPQSKLNFQEFQIIPDVRDFRMAYGFGQEFHRKLGEFLEKKFGKENLLLGDEAGFSCPFKSNEEALEILADLIAKYNHPLKIGLDVAASQFFQKNGTYLVNGKKYSAEELKNFYLKLIDSYGILSIEDPFDEESFDDFASLKQELDDSKLVITDDLTTTNPGRLEIAIKKNSGNAILIKLNQIGTLTETLKVVKLAYKNGWRVVVSHRSGETMDDFIADLAVGINAWGLKSGAPAKPERNAKYERVLKIFNLI